jgi:uncharacterized protein (DUF1684 family)
MYQDIELSKKQHLKIIFLPFSDLTSGKESYIGGRYIDLKFERKTIAVFNLLTILIVLTIINFRAH